MDWQSWLIGIVGRALAFGTPLLWGTLGEIYAERAGVLNLGVEGMMVLGALCGFAVTQSTGHPGPGIIIAAIVAGFAALLHAFLSITLRANQYVSGLALSMFGVGLAGLLGRSWVGIPLRAPLHAMSIPGLSGIPLIGPMLFSDQCILTYIGLALAVVLWVLLYRTRWGIVIRSVGESPGTADPLGVNVYLVRYLCVVFGGVMAGIGGAFLSVYYRPSWTEGMTAGMGWIVIALTIFSSWDPGKAIWGAIFFGALYHLSYRLQQYIPPEMLKLLPYAAAIGVLAIAGLLRGGAHRGAPGSLGMPYTRGEK